MADKNLIVQWFLDNKGKITYDMNRRSQNGYGDCSSCVSRALRFAGFSCPSDLSTVTLGSQLAKDGFTRISVNQDWTAEKGDIVLQSWGSSMASSGGAGGR
ncbi:MAG: hypothetical protein LBT10_01915 [Methanobrevibacter sp.]|jgi:hypothetical protein|nr:hypothetical protein [Methanobrevibacter sp.]